MAFAVREMGLRYSTCPKIGVNVTTEPDVTLVNLADISVLTVTLFVVTGAYKRAESAPAPITTETLPSVLAVRVGAVAGGLLSKL